MNYTDKVLSRITDPGTLILIVGAVVAYTSGMMTKSIADDKKRENASLAVKAVGGVIAMVGAVLLFT